MTPEEIADSDDVDKLYSQLMAAKAFDDQETVRLIQARMRELSGANTRAEERGCRVAVDGDKAGQVQRDATFRGFGPF